MCCSSAETNTSTLGLKGTSQNLIKNNHIRATTPGQIKDSNRKKIEEKTIDAHLQMELWPT